uniref:histidine kinase n=1 Tax=Grammatophora oceanica TaxID=210454 RepID=A0A7S1VH49_9STRA
MGYNSVEQVDASESELHPLSKNVGTAIDRRDVLNFFRQSQEIHENTQRAVSVLNDLLTYDKVEMGSMQLERDVVSISPLIEKTAKEFTAAAAQKKINFKFDFSRLESDLEKLGSKQSGHVSPILYPATVDACQSLCDDVRIAQVVRNLISNAIKFTREGGDITLSVSYVMPDTSEKNGLYEKRFTLKRGEEISASPCGALRLDVSDSGVGMTNEQLAVVFGDGVQFNANDLQKGNGTGLGLHIAKGIMELHGGKLTASSEGLGTGTTFSMVTPLYYLPNTGNTGIKEDSPQPSTSENPEDLETGPLRVLVVDDAPMNRKLLSRLLKNHDHICEEADDGDVAVDMVQASMEEGTPFDTVLLDNEMPRLSGPLAAKQMREMGSDVFIVGVTGNLLPDDVQSFKKCGANAVLPKPFKLAALEQLWIEYGVSSDHQRHDRTVATVHSD